MWAKTSVITYAASWQHRHIAICDETISRNREQLTNIGQILTDGDLRLAT